MGGAGAQGDAALDIAAHILDSVARAGHIEHRVAVAQQHHDESWWMLLIVKACMGSGDTKTHGVPQRWVQHLHGIHRVGGPGGEDAKLLANR